MTNCDNKPSNCAPADGSKYWLERGFLLALLLACGVAMSPNRADPDLWGHVQYGRDALSEGIAATTTYSYTAQGHPWINHENASEIILAVVADAWGGRGLLIMNCLLGLFVIFLMLRRARSDASWNRQTLGESSAPNGQTSTYVRELQPAATGVSLVAAAVGCLMVAAALAPHWRIRPQVFSYTLFAIEMALLAYCFGNWNEKPAASSGRNETETSQTTAANQRARLKWLWFAPLLFLFWTNAHGGFVAGYLIFAFVLVLRGLQAVWRRRRQGVGNAVQFAFLAAVTAAATLINPYGLGLHHWLLTSLGQPRPEIMEWHPPSWTSLESLPLAMLVGLGLVALLGTRRRRDPVALSVLAITLWQATSHQRHIPFFAIALGFTMLPHIESVVTRWRERHAGRQSEKGPSLSVPWAPFAGLCIVYVILTVKLYGRLSELRVDRDYYPVAALQFMADRGLSGRQVVTYNWAQYALASLAAQQQNQAIDPTVAKTTTIGFDGRFRTCYPQDVVDMHFDFILGKGGPGDRSRGAESPSFDPARVLKHGQPDLALISRRQVHSVAVMKRQMDWTLLYQDSLSQVWGKSSRYDDPNSKEYISPAERRIGDDRQQGYVVWPALPATGYGGQRYATKEHDNTNHASPIAGKAS